MNLDVQREAFAEALLARSLGNLSDLIAATLALASRVQPVRYAMAADLVADGRAVLEIRVRRAAAVVVALDATSGEVIGQVFEFDPAEFSS